jgi:hypothetical protein
MRSLEAALPNINGSIINNDAPTRVAERPGDADSCVDLTFVSVAALLEVSWKLLPLMGSGHRPAHRQETQSKPKWMTGEVDSAWEANVSTSREYTKAKRLCKGQVEIQAKREAFNLAVQQNKEVSNSKQEEWNRLCDEYDPRDPAVSSKF